MSNIDIFSSIVILEVMRERFGANFIKVYQLRFSKDPISNLSIYHTSPRSGPTQGCGSSDLHTKQPKPTEFKQLSLNPIKFQTQTNLVIYD